MTLLQLAFLRKTNLIFPREKSKWKNRVVNTHTHANTHTHTHTPISLTLRMHDQSLWRSVPLTLCMRNLTVVISLSWNVCLHAQKGVHALPESWDICQFDGVHAIKEGLMKLRVHPCPFLQGSTKTFTNTSAVFSFFLHLFFFNFVVVVVVVVCLFFLRDQSVKDSKISQTS